MTVVLFNLFRPEYLDPDQISRGTPGKSSCDTIVKVLE